jgi:ParB-like chromosome segregation protein Spo0J
MLSQLVSVKLVNVNDIVVDREKRQRRDIDTAELERSIKQIGLIQPIVISDELKLIVGERRLTAFKNLAAEGMAEFELIPAIMWGELSVLEQAIIELEENIKRKDLSWPDLVSAVATIHELYIDRDGSWTMYKTSEAISLSPTVISMYVKVFKNMDDERVRGATTIREAYNHILRTQQRRIGEAIEDLLEEPSGDEDGGGDIAIVSDGIDITLPIAPAEIGTINQLVKPIPAAAAPVRRRETVLCQSFLDWASAYTGPKFNFIHCDFPYGINMFSGPWSTRSTPITYSDSEDDYYILLETFCQQLDKFASISCHVMFWFSERHKAGTLDMFTRLAPSLKFHLFPLIWLKSDNVGIVADPRRQPRHIYETALLASRGDRNIVKVVGDAYSAPTDRRLGPSCKPEPMLRHFFNMLVDTSTRMLDPTCGTGSALRAAESLNAELVLGLDIEQESVDVARRELDNARKLAAGSRIYAGT